MAASNRRRRALTYDDLPPEMKDLIQDYLRHTNASLRAAVKEYFEDKAVAEFKYGKMNTWDVGRVTDMSRLFEDRTDFNEARAGVGRRRIASTRVEERRFHTAGLLDARRSTAFVGHRRVGHVVGDDDVGNVRWMPSL